MNHPELLRKRKDRCGVEPRAPWTEKRVRRENFDGGKTTWEKWGREGLCTWSCIRKILDEEKKLVE
ncbi:unnamed protein product [Sphenostylis stenocarpa]|uniref:Uncharacterized protein n=1 Tax=Sphenostylis stenocarpa TaxID=92480 RepID=A0AA86T3L2_9FABA|nr:unnamed protein product [Sphenostylis stenocarpa]